MFYVKDPALDQAQGDAEQMQAGEEIWYYAIKDKTYGPVSIAVLQHLLETAQLLSTSLVWRNGMEQWTPLLQVDALASLLQSIASPTPQTDPNAIAPGLDDALDLGAKKDLFQNLSKNPESAIDPLANLEFDSEEEEEFAVDLNQEKTDDDVIRALIEEEEAFYREQQEMAQTTPEAEAEVEEEKVEQKEAEKTSEEGEKGSAESSEEAIDDLLYVVSADENETAFDADKAGFFQEESEKILEENQQNYETDEALETLTYDTAESEKATEPDLLDEAIDVEPNEPEAPIDASDLLEELDEEDDESEKSEADEAEETLRAGEVSIELEEEKADATLKEEPPQAEPDIPPPSPVTEEKETIAPAENIAEKEESDFFAAPSEALEAPDTTPDTFEDIAAKAPKEERGEERKKSSKSFILPLAAAVILALVAVGFYFTKGQSAPEIPLTVVLDEEHNLFFPTMKLVRAEAAAFSEEEKAKQQEKIDAMIAKGFDALDGAIATREARKKQALAAKQISAIGRNRRARQNAPSTAREETPAPQERYTGGLSPQDIAKTVKTYNFGIKMCYEKQLKRNPNLSGKMILSITVQNSGKVTATSIHPAHFRNTVLAECLTQFIKRWRFPKFGGEAVVVDYPFVFSATQ